MKKLACINLTKSKNVARLALVVLMAVAQVQHAWALAWARTTVPYFNPENDYGEFSSIALSSEGDPYICHYDASQRRLRMNYRRNGNWYTSLLDYDLSVGGDVGKYCSIALDASNNAHISYYDAKNGNLKYVKHSRDFGAGTALVVHDEGDVGQWSSIALATHSDDVFISYYDATNNGALRSASRINGEWSTELVNGAGEVGKYSSIAVGRDEAIHISYYDEGNGNLKYARKEENGDWNRAILDSTGDVGQYTSIALDTEDNPYISYYDVTNRDLKYARKVGGEWNTLTIASSGNVGQHSSIAVTTYGNVYISYYDATNGDLRYARRAHIGQNSAWEREMVAETGTVGLYSSIAVDAAGKVFISYHNSTSGTLELAEGT